MSLGKQLQEARERKGISLRDAATATKVRVEVLQALEADDYSEMPAPVYAKGFLKMYAQYLGLDAQAARTQYDQEQQGKTPPPTLHRAAAQLHQSPIDIILSSVATMWRVWALVGAILVVLVLIVWSLISTLHRPKAGTVAHPPPATSQPTNHVQAVPAVKPDAYIKPAQPNAVLLDAGKTNAVPRPAATSAFPLTLSVRLTEDSWIEVVVDGKRLPYRTKNAGWTNEWHAQNRIDVTAGNAGGVRATLNSQELPPLGKHGERVKKTFYAPKR